MVIVAPPPAAGDPATTGRVTLPSTWPESADFGPFEGPAPDTGFLLRP